MRYTLGFRNRFASLTQLERSCSVRSLAHRRQSMLLGLVLLVLAKAEEVAAQNSPFLDSILHSMPLFRDSIAPRLADFELQVLYRPLSGPDSGITQRWNVDPEHYFYPASTVKLPVAALALEALHQLGVEGLDMHSPMEVGAAYPPQTPARERVGAPGQRASVATHVRDIGIVSSNEAYNRLYEWLGPAYINEALWRRGYRTRIVHRLGVSGYDTTGNRRMNPILFRHASRGDTLYFRAAAFAKTPFTLAKSGQLKGRGYYVDSTKQTVLEPFDFRQRNFLSLEDLTDMVQAIAAPETVPVNKRFALDSADQHLLLAAMNTRPALSDNPEHRDKPDGYVKSLYYGGDGAWEADGPTIYNKVGDAYGTLTDAALFVDPRTGRRYMLAATLLVNRDGIFNDGEYDYDSIGYPFLRELGRRVYHLGR